MHLPSLMTILFLGTWQKIEQLTKYFINHIRQCKVTNGIFIIHLTQLTTSISASGMIATKDKSTRLAQIIASAQGRLHNVSKVKILL